MTVDDDIPPDPGAYALVIRLETGFAGPAGALGDLRLSAGWYVYLGSANGPGGIAARVRWHLRADKRIHWHIDRLTGPAAVRDIAVWPGGGECALTETLRAVPGVTVPVAGFGASDCRRCPAHLLAAPDRQSMIVRLRQIDGVRLYSAASLISSAATDPAMV